MYLRDDSEALAVMAALRVVKGSRSCRLAMETTV
jgi:hypothetical protein